MKNNSIAIATMTWARDLAEENLLRASLTVLAATGLPVFITDGGSNAGFIAFMESFPQFQVFTAGAKGVWAQVKNSLEKAYDADLPFILYTEPDKLLFFRDALPSFLSSGQPAELGILLASRSSAAFNSFPVFQQMTETTINNCCAEVTGRQEDYTYGPFLINRRLVPFLSSVKEDIGWGWRPFAFCIAHRLGYPLHTMMGDFFCPVDQQEDASSERVYRMKQLQQNIQGIILSLSVEVPAVKELQ